MAVTYFTACSCKTSLWKKIKFKIKMMKKMKTFLKKVSRSLMKNVFLLCNFWIIQFIFIIISFVLCKFFFHNRRPSHVVVIQIFQINVSQIWRIVVFRRTAIGFFIFFLFLFIFLLFRLQKNQNFCYLYRKNSKLLLSF